MSLALSPVDGLAEGEVADDPLEEPELELPELLEPEPLPELPIPGLEDPGFSLEPLVPCAATRAGARPTTTTSNVSRIFFIASLLTIIGRAWSVQSMDPWPPRTFSRCTDGPSRMLRGGVARGSEVFGSHRSDPCSFPLD